MGILPKSFYESNDVLSLSKQLLGKTLHTNIDDQHTAGIIVEVEAYLGTIDTACHAWNGRKTKRTEILYRQGGLAYVYFTYGMHYMLNFTTGYLENANCILIRGIQPIIGEETMKERRKQSKVSSDLTAGPGRLTQALSINKDHYGEDLTSAEVIWVTDEKYSEFEHIELETGPRIGIGESGPDVLQPWRFWIKGNKYVSKAPKLKQAITQIQNPAYFPPVKLNRLNKKK
ncbi:MAG: DNA-3-methyladenine glycosylase [Bacteroidota bacterium]|nr:DNA-3-methyladenine glycosylase [Bacteroidota bacterium]